MRKRRKDDYERAVFVAKNWNILPGQKTVTVSERPALSKYEGW